jgi:carbon monoxide dehydrogenase subunit G
MPATSLAFDVGQPPERVFDFVADVRNELRWQKDVQHVEKIGAGPVGEGTVFDTRYRAFGDVRLELREYRRPEHVVFVGTGQRMWMRFAMDVEPTDGGSRVTFAVDMRPRSFLRPLTPLLSLGLPKEMAKRPEQLRAALAAAP